MRKKFLFLSVILLAAVFLSGCTGAIAWPGLSATDEVAYLANTTAVYALDLNDEGRELWNFSGEKSGFSFFNTNPSLFVSTPVVTPDGLVIILDSSNKHVMYAVDPDDIDEDNHPAIEWKFSDADGSWIAPPLIVDDRLFAPNSDGNVYVLDLQDGKSEKQAIKVIEISESQQDEARLWAQPVSDGERVFVTSLDKSVIAIDLATYGILWRIKDLGGAVPGGVAIGGDGMLYVGSLAKQLERFDPATGEHEPVLDTNGWIWGTPVVDGDNLYFGDVEGYFYSFNTSTGQLNFDPVKPDAAITSSPLVLGDLVLVATESGGIFSIDTDGSFDTWDKLNTDGKAYTTPVSAGGYVLVAYLESDYYLVAFDEDGDDQWMYPGK